MIMEKEKEPAWFEYIVIGVLILIGYLTDLELAFLLGSGLLIIGAHALFLGKLTIGYSFHYHSSATLARVLGGFLLLVGVNTLFFSPV